jgi:hypothetical protein
MGNKAVSTADLARMIQQVMNSEERQECQEDDPDLRFHRSYRVSWQGEQLLCHVALQRGVVPCPVCGALRGMGYLILSGRGVELQMRLEDIHVLEVHRGRFKGESIVDVDRLRTILGVAHLPLAEPGDETLRQVLEALWALQGSVIGRYSKYSPTMDQERARGYDTRWQDKAYRVWFPTKRGKPPICPLCGLPCHGLPIRVAAGETRVDVPIEARHLMEAHGLTEVEGWPAWNDPDDFERLRALLGVE